MLDITSPRRIEIAPQVFVPNIASGPSNAIQNVCPSNDLWVDDGDDEMFSNFKENAEKNGLHGGKIFQLFSPLLVDR